MKKIMILMLILFVLVSVVSAAVCAQEDADIAPEELVIPEGMDYEPLPEDLGAVDIVEPDVTPDEEMMRGEELDLGFAPEEEFVAAEEPPIAPARVAGPAVGFMIAYVVLVLVFVGIIIAAFVFWIWMIVDCAKRHFKNENEKIVWILVIVLVGVIGAIVYYFVGRKQATK